MLALATHPPPCSCADTTCAPCAVLHTAGQACNQCTIAGLYITRTAFTHCMSNPSALLKLAAGLLAGEQAYQKRAKVGLTPGLTRQVAGFQVSAEPDVYMLDTPGIMVPAVPSDEVGYRLALAGECGGQQGHSLLAGLGRHWALGGIFCGPISV